MTEKLELLEERVRDTLEETRSTVEDIVGNVKETVGETVGAVKETVDEAKSTVENIVENVKGTMDDTFTMVKNSFDLSYQMEQRPWLMVGGAVAVGWIIGRAVSSRSYAAYDYGEYDTGKEAYLRKTGGLTAMYSIDRGGDSGSTTQGRDDYTSASTPRKEGGRRWLPSLANFQEEIDTLKGAAIGTLMGTLREMIRQNMPNLAPQLEKAINSASAKLGAEPIDPFSQRPGDGHGQQRATSPTASSAHLTSGI